MQPIFLVTSMRMFQNSVRRWLIKCFGAEFAEDKCERSHRFLEESLELVQACGCTSEESHRLVDYVFSRPPGEKKQEVGGVAVTLAALCSAQGIDLNDALRVELSRINNKIEAIGEKQRNKPKMSPLPQ